MTLDIAILSFTANELEPRMLLRLGAAAGLSLIIGIERESPHRAAGMRTHVMVAIGSALFVLASIKAGSTVNDSTRVIQGVVQGIGFLGAGTILKLTDKAEVRGLTTAAGIWLTAAIGVACGLGEFWLALAATLMAWIALRPLKMVEQKVFPSNNRNKLGKKPGGAATAADPDDA